MSIDLVREAKDEEEALIEGIHDTFLPTRLSGCLGWEIIMCLLLCLLFRLFGSLSGHPLRFSNIICMSCLESTPVQSPVTAWIYLALKSLLRYLLRIYMMRLSLPDLRPVNPHIRLTKGEKNE